MSEAGLAEGERMRVVSLVPSVTETLVRWGLPPVACTRFCEQPQIPAVGGTKNPDVDAIVRLAPDLVVMCEEENRQEDADALGEAGVATAALVIEGLDDVPPAMAVLAGLVGAGSSSSGETSDAAGGFREAVDLALAAAHTTTGPSASTVGAGGQEAQVVRAFVPIWKRPWMSISANTYGASLLEALGVVSVLADAADRYPETTLEAAAALEPDVVLAPSEPYPFGERHVALLSEVAPVLLVDGQDLFWWGARTPEAIVRLSSQVRSVS